MSRSRRYHPFIGGGDSAKFDKRFSNRVERTRLRTILAHERFDDAEYTVWPYFGTWEGIKENRCYYSPWANECFCHPAGWYSRWSKAYECWYCREGGYQEWLKRRMRK